MFWSYLVELTVKKIRFWAWWKYFSWHSGPTHLACVLLSHKTKMCKRVAYNFFCLQFPTSCRLQYNLINSICVPWWTTGKWFYSKHKNIYSNDRKIAIVTKLHIIIVHSVFLLPHCFEYFSPDQRCALMCVFFFFSQIIW